MSVIGTRPLLSKACWFSRPGTLVMIMLPGLKPSLRFHSPGSMWLTGTGEPSGWLAGIEACLKLTRRPVSVLGSAVVK